MVILVLVKPVPDPDKYNEIKIDPETKRILRADVPAVIDPTSKNALEAALTLPHSKIIVLSMAPETNRDKIMECLAMGADEGYLLSDPTFGGADTYATSYVLAQGAKAILAEKGLDAFDLILAGSESADGATAHVPVQVAEWLHIPHAANVNHIDAEQTSDGWRICVTKKSEEVMLDLHAKAPALAAVTREINKPRHISAMGIVKARKKPLTIWTNEDLKLEEDKIGAEGSPTKAGELITPDLSRASAELTGPDATAEDAAKAILSLLRKAGQGA